MPELKPYNAEELAAALGRLPLENASCFAVACSGGADSLALTLLLHEWARGQGKTVIALHVDHQLRATSHAEAQTLKAWLDSHQIPLEILTWHHEGITSRIQERAREARYQLLQAAASRHQIEHLFLAHHLKDQEETFWMRLLKGSGTDGLAGMKPVSKRGNLTLLRPILNVHPERLRLFLNSHNQEWIQDPSNENPQYLRIRLRQLLRESSTEYSPEMLGYSMEKLREDADFMNAATDTWIANTVESSHTQFRCQKSALISLHPALGKRVLKKLLQRLHPTPYPPRSEALNRLWAQLQSAQFRATTLGHCLIRQSKGHLIFQREE